MSSPIASGRRWRWVTVQNPGPATPDGDGGYVEAFVDAVPGRMRVAIEAASRRDLEQFAGGSTLTQATHVITMPPHPDITTRTRFLYDGRIFHVIGAPIDVAERHRELVVPVAEVVA